MPGGRNEPGEEPGEYRRQERNVGAGKQSKKEWEARARIEQQDFAGLQFVILQFTTRSFLSALSDYGPM